jgi:hypothetical protein
LSKLRSLINFRSIFFDLFEKKNGKSPYFAKWVANPELIPALSKFDENQQY